MTTVFQIVHDGKWLGCRTEFHRMDVRRTHYVKKQKKMLPQGLLDSEAGWLEGPVSFTGTLEIIEILQYRKRPFGPSSPHQPQSHPGPTPTSLPTNPSNLRISGH